MPKINIFVPLMGLALVLIVIQAPTIAEYMSDTNQLENRMKKCLEEVDVPEKDMRCINASAAATQQWQVEMNAVVSVLNEKNAVVTALIETCTKPSCYLNIPETPEGKELEVAKRAWQTLQAAKPPVWTAS